MDTDHDKIIKIEANLKALSDVVNEIKDNHLVHLQESMEGIRADVQRINVKLALWSGGIIVAVWILDKLSK